MFEPRIVLELFNNTTETFTLTDFFIKYTVTILMPNFTSSDKDLKEMWMWKVFQMGYEDLNSYYIFLSHFFKLNIILHRVIVISNIAVLTVRTCNAFYHQRFPSSHNMRLTNLFFLIQHDSGQQPCLPIRQKTSPWPYPK